jgi:predicted ATPase
MEPAHLIPFGPFSLDVTHGRLWRGDQDLRLRPRSLAVLRYLVAHPGRLVTKAELRRQVWQGTHVTDSVLRASIKEIRAALGDAASAPRYVETVDQQGYRFRMGDDLEASLPLTPGPIVGRQGEVDVLEGWCQRAASGRRQLVFVSGEVGVGKTTVVDLLWARLAARREVWSARGMCVEHHGEGEPYLPLLEALAQLGGGPGGADVLAALRRYAPLWLGQLPGLLSETERARLQPHVHGATPARMLRELAESLEALTADRLLVVVLEDLHWSDRSTVELLAYLGQRQAPARLLVLGTYRPVEVMLQAHPLRGAVQELCGRGQAVELRLEFLPTEDVAAYVAGRLGGPIKPDLAAFVHARTDGNALFMVNLVEYLMQQGLVVRRAGQWTLRDRTDGTLASLPEGVRQLLGRRLEALTPQVQRVLEAASVVGETFAVAAVAAGVQCPVAEAEALCEGLAAQHHIIDDIGLTVWPDGTVSGDYRFQHALYQQVLYERLGSARRVQLHRRIGARLEAGYGNRAGELAAQLAVHFERGGEMSQAVHYWQQVGATASRRHAHHEAIAALRKGLALLATLPDRRERTQQELALQLPLGELLMAAKGMAALDVGEVYTRARALCHQLGEPPQAFQVLQGLYRFHEAQARLSTAAALAQQLFDLATRQPGLGLVWEGRFALGSVAFFHGDLVTARVHLEESLRLSETWQPAPPTFAGGLDPRVQTLDRLALVLWGLGYADQAQRRSQTALTLAQQGGHPPTQVFAELMAAILSQCQREVTATHVRAEAVRAVAAEQGLVHRGGHGDLLQGWALAMRGDAIAGVAQIRQGLAVSHGEGLNVFRPYFLALLAESYGLAGQPDPGRQALAEALTLVGETEERWWEAELHRLQGALWLQLPSADVRQAEACFQRALDVARRQQAKALELRAAMSLARLWQSQGKPQAAYDLLAPVYAWFTEGFDTADLQETKALLEELA